MGSDQEYEFMGPTLGPIGIMAALPLVCYGLVYACNAQGCLDIRHMSIPGFPAQSPLISREAFFAIFGWMAFQTILHLALPGKLIKGVTLPNNEKLTYKLNESKIYNFFIGRELNPRIASFDLKHFCELYPGLIGWLIIDLGMLQKQYEQLHYFIYVLDALWFEKAILSTMDIVHDGFGFMLAFGDLVWVPFTYSLQARYLVDHPQAISNVGLLGILGLKAVGYCAFRGANSQKDTFRNDHNHPSVRHLQTLKTERGTQLITSGWWGIARHINYTGDWLMAWSWCLPCGFGSIVPYFYVIYFAVLLVHRQQRDEHACKRKYGADWDKYQAIVKFRLIPFVY
ncbi:MAG: sterol reductase [Trebouxia sp. A1-2]|nr:MAG: sterol reductase [Trebouxia sp. A1-2]